MSRLSYRIAEKGLDHGCHWFCVEPLINSRVTEKEIKMNKQDKNGKDKATLEEMVTSGSQLILMHEDGTEQAVEEMLEDDPLANAYHYKNWWNQFRGPWLQSEKMTVEEIKFKADDAWECGDYKEMINLMAELICRLEKN